MNFRCKAIEIHFVCLTSLALRFISWYSARVLLLSPSAKVFGTCDGWRDSMDKIFSPYWHMDVA